MNTIRSIRCFKYLRILNITNTLFLNVNHVRNIQIISLCGAQNILTSNSNLYNLYNLQIFRYKKTDKKKPKKNEVTDSEDENESVNDFEDDVADKQSKTMNVKVNSLRADVILKAGLGIARNKIETMFYENKIRVNGEKLPKKSALLNEGDEIDIVRGTSPLNPEFLTVSRVEILSTSERSEGLNVKLRRNKSLTIDNYPHNPYKV